MERETRWILLWVLCCGTAVTTASSAPATRSIYAIKDAKVYTVSGPILPKGTVVIRNGLIESVGADVQIPVEATIVNADGMTVYPGLIDSFSDTGLAAAPLVPPVQQPAARNAREALLSTAIGLSPERTLADQVRPEGRNIEAYRNLGVTSALVVSRDGIITGQSALINTSDANIVVKSPVALHINPVPMNGGYPGSLMGVFAVLRQTFSDADWYRQVWDRFNANPRGVERPEYDKTDEAMVAIVQGRVPVIIHANWAAEIQRAVALARELRLKAVIAGAMEAGSVVDILKSNDVPVLVSVNYNLEKPRRGNNTVPFEFDEQQLKAFLGNTALLAKAGVRFALQSGFADRPQAYIDNIRKAIENGLTTDQALRAATLSAAEILGLGDALGSLEPGKIANVVVSSGEPFARGAAIRHVFVDGKHFQPASAPERTTNNTSTPATPAATKTIIRPGSYITPTPKEVLIRNATVLTIANGTLRNGSILIRDGKIAGIGTGLQAPDGALVIDGTGKYVMPGIIDAHSHIAIEGGVNEATSPVTSNVRVADVIRDDDVAIYRALAGGTTIVNILHGSANPIGGTNAVIKLKWGRPSAEMLFDAPPGIKLALGENPKRSNQNQPQNNRRFPATRMGVEDVLREAFSAAQRYRKEWDDWNAAKSRGENPVPPRRDLKLETLADVLRGKILVHAHCYIDSEILMLLQLADEFGFKIKTLQHTLEGYKVAKEIAAHGAAASTFADFWAYKVEAWDAIPYNAAIMKKYGVNVSINSDDESRVRRLYQEAARALHYSEGELTEDDVLKMITLNPATQLDIAHRTGSIEIGKDADLAIFNAHPLSSYAVVEKTVIEGQIYFDRELDLTSRSQGESK